MLREVRAALDRMPEERRRAVRLHLQGFKTGQVANLLGWTEPKARNLAYRTMNELRRDLRKRGFDYEAD